MPLLKFRFFYFSTESGMLMRTKKREGRALPDTPEMKMWREEYEQMPLEEHKAKLKALGLGEEEFSEFSEVLLKEKSKKGK